MTETKPQNPAVGTSLRVSAGVITQRPSLESYGRTTMGSKVELVASDLQTGVMLLEQDGSLFVLVASHLMTHQYRTSNILRKGIADTLGIPMDHVSIFSSHNHCTAKLIKLQYTWGLDEAEITYDVDQLTPDGVELYEKLIAMVVELKPKLQPVTVRYGKGHERRISHNRKGRRADGSTYMMREEDRLLQGEDFCGDIDDDAFVVGFFGEDNKPVCFLTHFTAHPVTAFHCDHPIVHGEFPQVAGDDLSAAFGGVPVLFLQGCAGDVNSKGLLAHTPAEVNIANAEKYGHMLGDTYIEIAKNLTESKSSDLRWSWSWVFLPYDQLPSQRQLEDWKADVEGFIERCDAGEDDSTRRCFGFNFPTNMSIPYRKNLMSKPLAWLEWVLDFYRNGNFHEVPISRRFRNFQLRIGDVGIVGLPCEPFLELGRQIKNRAPAPCTLPCGYVNDTSPAYVPDGANCRDLEYMSAFYRHTTAMLPYLYPAGDRLAAAGAEDLRKLFEG